MGREISGRAAGREEMRKCFDQSHDQYAEPVDRAFERMGWIIGAPSKRRMKGKLSVTRTAGADR